MNEQTIQKMRDLITVQGQKGNWDHNEYMRGLYNGMEQMLAIAEDREPVYKESQKKEVPQDSWDDVVTNARFMLEEYKKIPGGMFGATMIAQTLTRYDNGERTKELYEELKAIE